MAEAATNRLLKHTGASVEGILGHGRFGTVFLVRGSSGSDADSRGDGGGHLKVGSSRLFAAKVVLLEGRRGSVSSGGTLSRYGSGVKSTSPASNASINSGMGSPSEPNFGSLSDDANNADDADDADDASSPVLEGGGAPSPHSSVPSLHSSPSFSSSVPSISLSSIASLDPAIASLRREVDLLECLRPTPDDNIVGFIGAQRNFECEALLMEYMEGGSVRALLERNGALRPSINWSRNLPSRNSSDGRLESYTHQLIMGVTFLHESGVCHRDLKCSNLLLSGDLCTLKVADFGQIKWTTSHSARGLSGSPLWLAPEVIKEEIDHSANSSTAYMRADIWSLGCTVVEMATGKSPWDGIVSSVPQALYCIATSNTPPPLRHSSKGNAPKASPVVLSEEGCEKGSDEVHTTEGNKRVSFPFDDESELAEKRASQKLVQDFVNVCCAVNAADRPFARMLLEHKWLKRTLEDENTSRTAGFSPIQKLASRSGNGAESLTSVRAKDPDVFHSAFHKEEEMDVDIVGEVYAADAMSPQPKTFVPKLDLSKAIESQNQKLIANAQNDSRSLAMKKFLRNAAKMGGGAWREVHKGSKSGKDFPIRRVKSDVSTMRSGRVTKDKWSGNQRLEKAPDMKVVNLDEEAFSSPRESSTCGTSSTSPPSPMRSARSNVFLTRQHAREESGQSSAYSSSAYSDASADSDGSGTLSSARSDLSDDFNGSRHIGYARRRNNISRRLTRNRKLSLDALSDDGMLIVSASESSGTESGSTSMINVGIKSASLGVSVLSVEPASTSRGIGSPHQLVSLKKLRKHRNRANSKRKKVSNSRRSKVGVSSSQSSEEGFGVHNDVTSNNVNWSEGRAKAFPTNLNQNLQHSHLDSASESEFADNESGGWESLPHSFSTEAEKCGGGKKKRLPSLGKIALRPPSSDDGMIGSDADESFTAKGSFSPRDPKLKAPDKRSISLMDGKLDGEDSLISDSMFLSLNAFPKSTLENTSTEKDYEVEDFEKDGELLGETTTLSGFGILESKIVHNNMRKQSMKRKKQNDQSSSFHHRVNHKRLLSSRRVEAWRISSPNTGLSLSPVVGLSSDSASNSSQHLRAMKSPMLNNTSIGEGMESIDFKLNEETDKERRRRISSKERRDRRRRRRLERRARKNKDHLPSGPESLETANYNEDFELAGKDPDTENTSGQFFTVSDSWNGMEPSTTPAGANVMLRMWLAAARQMLQNTKYDRFSIDEKRLRDDPTEWFVDDFHSAIAYENDLIYARDAWSHGSWRKVLVAIDWDEYRCQDLTEEADCMEQRNHKNSNDGAEKLVSNWHNDELILGARLNDASEVKVGDWLWVITEDENGWVFAGTEDGWCGWYPQSFLEPTDDEYPEDEELKLSSQGGHIGKVGEERPLQVAWADDETQHQSSFSNSDGMAASFKMSRDENWQDYNVDPDSEYQEEIHEFYQPDVWFDASSEPLREVHLEVEPKTNDESESEAALNSGVVFEAVACAMYTAETKVEVSFREGELVRVHERTNDIWWYGEVVTDGRRGYFPATYVSILRFAR